jgi:hypothetical protein
MAVTIVNLSDPVSTFVSKTNIISGDVGDVAQLVSGDSNCVDAINTFIERDHIYDSSHVIGVIPEVTGFSSPLNVSTANAEGLSLTFDSATAQLGISGTLADSSVGSSQLKNAVTLQILDYTGTVLKTIYGAGE